MTKYFKYLFFFTSLIIFGSCQLSEQKTTTYFGGKIINPKSSYVLLFNQKKLIDSLPLDANNTFLGRYENIEEGFYTFFHGKENQYVYIQPNDSISIRLNTWDYDESLVFDGKGGEKNNLLIDFFLETEKDRRSYSFSSFFSLQPLEFKTKMDSVLAKKTEKITLFKKNNPELPKEYLNLLEVFAKYPIYNRVEYYPEVHRRRTGTTEFPKTTAGFYNYRTNINLNDSTLINLRTYNEYVMSRVYNTVYSKGVSNDNPDLFITELLASINKNINLEEIKNDLLRQVLLNYFVDNSTGDINKEAFYDFFKLSTNIEDKKQIQRLLNDIKILHENQKLPDFHVIDYNKAKQSIRKLTKNKNSVIFFWNPKYYNSRSMVARMDFLTKKHPNIYFISVKTTLINGHHTKGFDIKNQFYLDEETAANDFLTSKFPRTLLVNKKGIIFNSFASFHKSIISKQIEELENN
ncbi:hypothetical protein GCM10011416_18190 [Polaribacter pacificus]|uniref:Thioredoxin domain-containing protein n=1 Tax=Polaribacter pacificus TaxID=1775173 RepID=A0A917MGE8_9FLAO|nr:hypothetical protein [Polaribacter pacificus]GGH00056.1 hypothetical protein GCM10011416_18190 [Polaribacter pacificus]